ncbi:hypothetical protein SLS62_006051 [Diatrype stigma]|uniref:Uncharacterized protein n=1 Tax=Diatrype stigma TaxID=117547 RepID=A0AAN9UNU5_9PEZI
MGFSIRTVACFIAGALLLVGKTNAAAIPGEQEDAQATQLDNLKSLSDEARSRTHVALASKSWENNTVTWYKLNEDSGTPPRSLLSARGRWKGGDVAVPSPGACKVTEGPESDECVATGTCYTYGSAQSAARQACHKLSNMIKGTPSPMEPGTSSLCIKDDFAEDPNDAECCIAWSNKPRDRPLEADWNDLDVTSDALHSLCSHYDRMSGVVHGAWMGGQCVNACIGKNTSCFKG